MTDDKRSAVVSRIPGETQWREMPVGQQRSFASTLLRDAIEVIADEGREPDPCESLELRCAIDALEQRLYATLLVFVERALRPVPNRRPFFGFRGDKVASLNDLRQAFAATASQSPAF
jgi:hypothetical protein